MMYNMKTAFITTVGLFAGRVQALHTIYSDGTTRTHIVTATCELVASHIQSLTTICKLLASYTLPRTTTCKLLASRTLLRTATCKLLASYVKIDFNTFCK
jgi:hypothetical protein